MQEKLEKGCLISRDFYCRYRQYYATGVDDYMDKSANVQSHKVGFRISKLVVPEIILY